jgi:signal peptide peptidase SppA
MHDLARLSARLYNTPLLVLPETAATIAEALGDRLAGLGPLKAFEAESTPQSERKSYSVVDGVATIPLRGELVNRGSFLNSLSGLTSYDALKSAFAEAARDPSVRSVLLDVDSPGGEAAGMVETAAALRELDAAKPVIAFVNALAASAGYGVAAGARKIVATPSATLGSIGVVWMHLDRSAQYAKAGVKPTLLHAGAFKVDGHAYAELDPETRSRIQAQIDDVYSLFLDTVGKHRPALGPEGARKTEAGVFIGRKAVDAGLADTVGDLRTALSAFPRKSLFAFGAKHGGNRMIDEPTYTQAAYDAGIANAVAAATRDAEIARTSAAAEADQAGRRAGAEAERTRIRTILDSEAAKGKQALARHFALSTDMSPEAAATALAAAAPEQTGRMAQVPSPNLKPDSSQRSENPQADADAAWGNVAANLNASLPGHRRRA